MIAVITTTFNGIPKPNCDHSLIESLVQHESQQHLLVVPVLKILVRKLPLCLLCTIINTGSDNIVLPQNRHLGEMKPLSDIDDSLKPLVVNEGTHAIDSDHVNTQCM